MAIDRNIISEVRKQSNAMQKALTPQQVFSSPEFSTYLQNTIDTLTGKYAEKVKIDCIHDDPEGMTAATDGKKIILNTNNSIVNHYETLLSKYMCLMGMAFHESAHVIFLDFDGEKRAMETIKSGDFYGETPEVYSDEEEEALAELTDALAVPEYAGIFQEIYHNLSNIISDPHDEYLLSEKFGGFVRQGITFTEEALRASTPAFEEMLEDDDMPPVSIMFNLILQFARFGEIIATDMDKALSSEYLQKLSRASTALELARDTDDTTEKFSQMNVAVLALWPYIKEILDEADEKQGDGGSPQQGESSQSDSASNGSSQGQGNPSAQGGSSSQSQGSQGGQKSNSSNSPQGQQQGSQGQASSQSGQPQQGSQGGGVPNPQAIQKVLDEISKAVNAAGTTQAPQNGKSSKTAKANAKAKSTSSDGNGKNKGSAAQEANEAAVSDGTRAALEAITKAIADAMAETSVEGELTSGLLAIIQQVNQNSTHRGLPTFIHRELDVTDSNVNIYNAKMKDLGPYSKRLQRQMKDALRDMVEGTVMKHRHVGNRFSVGDAYRPDQKFYTNKKLPKDMPEMAVYVLNDMSGSMHGRRLDAAMDASLLLYDFAVGLGIPVGIAGHNTAGYGNGINYHVFTDMNKVGNKDKYRITKMKANNSNRDGMAVQIAGQLLAQRPEEIKLLIVISDGQPNDSNYGGEAAAKDIRDIVKKLKKSGVETVAAAIGDDKERIKSIYGDGFLDITDLSKLPKELVSLVRKRILSR